MRTSLNAEYGVGPDPGESALRECDECGRPYPPSFEGDNENCGRCE